ncbi:MAG TPA: hypothetical protein VNJ28_01370, partial [Candidatus Limnocylindrales bacterium]|nr:hypothetical protein [Candidatus Limnocylindrales bacterium]
MAESRDPLAGVDRLVVDGTNLLGAVERAGGSLSPTALVGRLRAAVPRPIRIDLVLDGRPSFGLGGTRIAPDVEVRFAGDRPADDLVAVIVRELAGRALDRGGSVLVVTDDRGLRDRVRA